MHRAQVLAQQLGRRPARGRPPRCSCRSRSRPDVEGQVEAGDEVLGGPHLLGAGRVGDVVVLHPGQVPDQPADRVRVRGRPGGELLLGQPVDGGGRGLSATRSNASVRSSAGVMPPDVSPRSRTDTCAAMTNFGYTLMTEQSGPRELVQYAVAAERAGFDFEVCSDHYSPWLTEQGHSPYAWSVLGRRRPRHRAGRADDLRDLPDDALPPGGGRAEGRDHGAAVGGPVHARRSAAARTSTSTRSARAGRRSRPARRCSRRRSRSSGQLFGGDLVTYRGEHFAVDSARLWDLPEEPVRIGARGLRRPQRRAVRAAGRRPDRRRAEGRADRRRGTPSRARPGSVTGRGPSGSSRSAGTPTRRPRSSGRTSSSAGSAAAGTSTPTSRPPPASPRRASS